MKQLLIVLIFFVAGCSGNDKNGSADNTSIADANINGEILFKANCASCHKPDKEFTAPALKGALQRWSGDKKAMYAFIRNPMETLATNTYAKKLLQKWKFPMTGFRLSDAQLDAIMKYVETGK